MTCLTLILLTSEGHTGKLHSFLEKRDKHTGNDVQGISVFICQLDSVELSGYKFEENVI